eukprot:GHVU01206723.1.p1 GENE.GHVU01206723.1~~GHVU01206723.1.p1  ORF type:complete len:476 (+),score=96.77 GHVU01206723.1:70-1497(+)
MSVHLDDSGDRDDFPAAPGAGQLHQHHHGGVGMPLQQQHQVHGLGGGGRLIAPGAPPAASGQQRSRLRYRIACCSSEDPEFPSSELLVHNAATRGWNNSRQGRYPEELGFELECASEVKLVQLLSHQSKIASKIEIYVASEESTDDYDSAAFRRLGYLVLDANARTKYQARELKSVHVDVTTKFLKLLIHQSHPNPVNQFNQVGLVAVSVWGYPPRSGGDSLVNDDSPTSEGGLKGGGVAGGSSDPLSSMGGLGGGPSPHGGHQHLGVGGPPPGASFSPLSWRRRAEGQHHLYGGGGLSPGAAAGAGGVHGQFSPFRNQYPSQADCGMATNAGMAEGGVNGGGGGLMGLGVMGAPGSPYGAGSQWGDMTRRSAVPDFPSGASQYDGGEEMGGGVVDQLNALRLAKARAVEREDYEEAKRLKERIEELQNADSKITQLEEAKRRAVAREDYDTAKKIKEVSEYKDSSIWFEFVTKP